MIIETDTLPAVGADEHRALVTFISFQVGRTPDAAAVMRRMQERLGDAYARTVGELFGGQPSQAALDQIRAGWWAPLPESLKNAELGAPLLLDLRLKLLICPVGHAFITSDSPAVLLNPWCRGWTAMGVTGLACGGLLVFLPLSPRHLLLLVDEDVYSIAGGVQRAAH